jgi:hypothetical protein
MQELDFLELDQECLDLLEQARAVLRDQMPDASDLDLLKLAMRAAIEMAEH